MNSVELWQAFLQCVNDLSGVSVLGTLKHDFPGGGFTGLVLLGESHAAIHTWPELKTAWVELATCGDPLALVQFTQWAQQMDLKHTQQVTTGGDG